MNKLVKIATWNVNSLRVRLNHVLEWLRSKQPHVLALQETKVENKHFPKEVFQQAGYHVLFNGQKAYNGVAIISRLPLYNPIMEFKDFDDSQRRFLTADAGSLRLINVYVPNGAHITSAKYTYKLNWLKQLQRYLREELKHYPHLILLGDFNIAPEDKDVHDPIAMGDNLLVSPQERQALKALMKLGLEDSFRLFNKDPRHYSWWDYRAGAFQRNHGFRIDHILSSSTLAPYCISCEIDKEARGWEKPSDHAPVIASYQLIA